MIAGLIIFILIGLGVTGAVTYQLVKGGINKAFGIIINIIGLAIVIAGFVFLIKELNK